MNHKWNMQVYKYNNIIYRNLAFILPSTLPACIPTWGWGLATRLLSLAHLYRIPRVRVCALYYVLLRIPILYGNIKVYHCFPATPPPMVQIITHSATPIFKFWISDCVPWQFSPERVVYWLSWWCSAHKSPTLIISSSQYHIYKCIRYVNSSCTLGYV